MKKILLGLSVLVLIGCGESKQVDVKRILVDSLTKNDGIIYYKDIKFSGVSFDVYDNDSIKSEKSYKDGKYDGLSRQWYENGQLEWESNFKDGRFISTKEWDENGNLKN